MCWKFKRPTTTRGTFKLFHTIYNSPQRKNTLSFTTHHASGWLPFTRGFCSPTWGGQLQWRECIVRTLLCHTIVLTLSILGDSNWEFIRDDELIDETIDDPSVFSCQGRPLEYDESSEDLKQITANINAHYSGKCPQCQPNDNMITEQIITLMYCFSVPVSVTHYWSKLII